MVILFVGEAPARRNANENVAFAGTQSYSQLQEWFKDMPLQPRYINQNEQHCEWVVWQFFLAGLPIVAVGKQAAQALADLNVRYCSIPHPSGRNRVLNDKVLLDEKLQLCKDYILSFIDSTQTLGAKSQ